MLKVALVLLCLTCVRCDVAKVCGQMKALEGKVQKLHQGTAKADITITAGTSVVDGACSFDVSCAQDGKPVIKTQQVKMKVAQEIDVHGSLFTGNVISIKDSIVVGEKKSKICFHGAIDEEKNISELHFLTAAGECNAMNGLCRVLAWQAVATAAGTTESYLLDHAHQGCQLPSGKKFQMNLKFYQLKAKDRTYYEGFGYESVGDEESFANVYKGNKFPMSKYRYRRVGEVEITDASLTTQVGLLIVGGEKGPPDFTVAKMLTQDQILKLPNDSPVELKQDGKWVQTTVINRKYQRGSDQIKLGIEVDKKTWVTIATLVESKRLRGEVPCAGVAECAPGKTVAQCTAAIWPAKLKLPAHCNCGLALENWMWTNPTWKQVFDNNVYRLTLPKKEAPVLGFLEAGSKSSHGLLRRN